MEKLKVPDKTLVYMKEMISRFETFSPQGLLHSQSILKVFLYTRTEIKSFTTISRQSSKTHALAGDNVIAKLKLI